MAQLSTGNPIAEFYNSGQGYPAWTDTIAWDNVIEMTNKGSGSANFAEFESKRDQLASQGGGVLYYPEGTYDFEVPKGPNGRGLMLKANVVVRGAAPSSDTKAVISYNNAGLSTLGTVFNFTATEYDGPCLMNFIGGTPSDVSGVGIVWVHLKNAYIHFGFDADSWAPSWATSDSWLTAFIANGWGERKPDGSHIMDAWVGDGTHGKYDNGNLTVGSMRFVFGCKLTNAKIHNYAINRAKCGSFTADAESWRFGGIVSVYGSHIFVANNVMPKIGSSADNRLGVDVNKQLIAFHRNRCDVKNRAGYYGEDVIVRDNWVFNKGNKSYEIAGTWTVVRDNVAHKEFLSGTPTFHSCLNGVQTTDYMNRGYDFAGMGFWAHNNEVRETGSGGNDGEGMLVQRHNEVETFSHAWTDNTAYKHDRQAHDKGYISPYDTHVLGMLQLRNKTTGNVGIRKLESNRTADIAVVLNQADDGIAGTEAADFLVDCPAGQPTAPIQTSALRVENGVKISWTDAANNEIGFRIDRKIGTGAIATIAYRPRHSLGSNTLSYAPSGGGGGGPCDCETPAGFDFNPPEWIDYLAPSVGQIQYRVVAINCDDNDAGASSWITVNGYATDVARQNGTATNPSMLTPKIKGSVLFLNQAVSARTYVLMSVSGRLIQSGVIPSDLRIPLTRYCGKGVNLLHVSGLNGSWAGRVMNNE